MGLAAVNTANNLLYLVLGLLLSLLLVSGVLSDLALWKLRFARSLPRHVFAGQRALIDLTAFNDKRWLSSVSIEATEDLEDTEVEPAHLMRIPPEHEATASYGLRPTRRGLLELGGVRVATRYPFGLIEKGYTLYLPDEVVVFPQLLGDLQMPPLEQTPGDAAATQRTGRGSEFAGSVRYYRDGDEAREIHWKRTASRGELVVREREQDQSLFVTLVIDDVRPPAATEPSGEDSAWRERFEHSISEVATMTASYLVRGVSVQVRASRDASPRVLGGSSPDPIWRFLALLRPKAPEASPEAGIVAA